MSPIRKGEWDDTMCYHTGCCLVPTARIFGRHIFVVRYVVATERAEGKYSIPTCPVIPEVGPKDTGFSGE